MRVLGIESSCDETAVALVESRGNTVEMAAQAVSSQVARHRAFGGVVPELATREHLRNLPQLVPAVLRQAGLGLPDLDALAVTEGPGLASSLLIGHAYARGLGVALGLPVMGVNHLEGHLVSPFLGAGRPVAFPFVGLVASGGHTLLVRAEGWNDYRRLGSTVDDAAGEAFDKVARLFGLPYPGGPEIEKLAAGGNPAAYDLPRSFPERDNFNFSFSGLKTAARLLHEREGAKPGVLSDLCASFQQAILDVLVRKAVRAAETTGTPRLAASGGVLGNGALRRQLETACRAKGIELLVASPALCTDNAAMIAGTAAAKLQAGLPAAVGADIDPGLTLFQLQPAG